LGVHLKRKPNKPSQIFWKDQEKGRGGRGNQNTRLKKLGCALNSGKKNKHRERRPKMKLSGSLAGSPGVLKCGKGLLLTAKKREPSEAKRVLFLRSKRGNNGKSYQGFGRGDLDVSGLGASEPGPKENTNFLRATYPYGMEETGSAKRSKARKVNRRPLKPY